MKPHNLLLALLCLFAALCAAWTKEDHEIFRLRDEVEAAEGEAVTFYDFVGVKPSATYDEINKAYRKKSKSIHPDKARQSFIANYARTHAKPTPKPKPGQKKKPVTTKDKKPSQREIRDFYKHAQERYSRLTVVADILRGPQRERYDYFLKNGFPKWRGTGYYYSRFRPGLGSVLLGLFLVGGGAAHYGALVLGWKRQRDFVERYIRHARRMAWGDETGISGIAGVNAGVGATGYEPPVPQDAGDAGAAMNRRQKRLQEREAKKSNKSARAANKARSSGISTPTEAQLTSGPQGTKKRVQAENGKILIVDSVGNVYLEEETDEGEIQEFLLDVNEIVKPTIYDTAVFRLPAWFYRKSLGRIFGSKSSPPNLSSVNGTAENTTPEEEHLREATSNNLNAETKKRKAKAKGT